MKRKFNITKDDNLFRSFYVYGQVPDYMHPMSYPTECFYEIITKLMLANNSFGTPQAFAEEEGWELIEVTGKED